MCSIWTCIANIFSFLQVLCTFSFLVIANSFVRILFSMPNGGRFSGHKTNPNATVCPSRLKYRSCALVHSMATAVLLQINWKLSNLLTEFCIVFQWICFRNFCPNTTKHDGRISILFTKKEKSDFIQAWAMKKNGTMTMWMKCWSKFVFGVVAAAALCLCCTFSIWFCVSMLQLWEQKLFLLFIIYYLFFGFLTHNISPSAYFLHSCFALHSMTFHLLVEVVLLLFQTSKLVQHISGNFHGNTAQILWIKTYLNYLEVFCNSFLHCVHM